MIEPKTLKKDQRCWAFTTLTNPASSRHDDWNSPTEVNVYFSIPKLEAEVKWINMRGQQSNEIDKSRLRNLRLKRVKRQQLRGNLLWSTASKWTKKKKAFAIEGSENIIHRSLRHETNSNEMGVWVFCIQNQPERRG